MPSPHLALLVLFQKNVIIIVNSFSLLLQEGDVTVRVAFLQFRKEERKNGGKTSTYKNRTRRRFVALRGGKQNTFVLLC